MNDTPSDRPTPAGAEQTNGDDLAYRRVGTFTLDLPVGEITLAAYEHAPGADRLWVPFIDATSGEETYALGRYVEAYPIPDDLYLVDLNLAYHPFCAYSDQFTCAVPPEENHVDVAIRVGERLAE